MAGVTQGGCLSPVELVGAQMEGLCCGRQLWTLDERGGESVKLWEPIKIERWRLNEKG